MMDTFSASSPFQPVREASAAVMTSLAASEVLKSKKAWAVSLSSTPASHLFVYDSERFSFLPDCRIVENQLRMVLVPVSVANRGWMLCIAEEAKPTADQ